MYEKLNVRENTKRSTFIKNTKYSNVICRVKQIFGFDFSGGVYKDFNLPKNPRSTN